jgi:type III protein arginine methyltransferase
MTSMRNSLYFQFQVRDFIAVRTEQLATERPDLEKKNLIDINSEAAALQKAGDAIGAAALYCLLFRRAARRNVTHPELYICHSNAAGALLSLGLHEDALRHANACRRLAEASLRRNFKGSSSYVKSFDRRGRALLGLDRSREAAAAFEEGLKLDPFNVDLKVGLQEANQRVLSDLVEGRHLF